MNRSKIESPPSPMPISIEAYGPYHQLAANLESGVLRLYRAASAFYDALVAPKNQTKLVLRH
jgi:hypothetical protein